MYYILVTFEIYLTVFLYRVYELLHFKFVMYCTVKQWLTISIELE
jgi:hypothetical protein